MMTICPHCAAWALVVGTTTASFYGGARLLWQRVICWRGHRSLSAWWK
jgi:hypothetical protein